MANTLIVDDEEMILGIIRRFLDNKGHFVRTAINGKAGLEQNRGNNFDIIITDIFMP